MNVDIKCPNCGAVYTVRREILGKRTKCTQCGQAFVIAEASGASKEPRPAASTPIPDDAQWPTAPTSVDTSAIPPFAVRPESTVARRKPFPGAELFGFERDPNAPRFPALRMVARGYEILAVVVLVIAAVMLVVFMVAVVREAIREPDNFITSFIGAIFAYGFTFFWAAITALTLLFFAQFIRLNLQIEQNTRETRDSCQRLADHLCMVERDA
jgi:predicted Zn finger-like uncharacterized protein